MHLKVRWGFLALAAFLALLAISRYRGAWNERSPAQVFAAVAPILPPAAIPKVKKKKAPVKIALKHKLGPVRGERLREKGESLWGGIAERPEDASKTAQ